MDFKKMSLKSILPVLLLGLLLIGLLFWKFSSKTDLSVTEIVENCLQSYKEIL